MNVTIFYSWQSDTPFNNKEIRLAIREAMNALERELSNVILKLDEATSNQVGSLHIPNSILNNITESDIFIGDLSTVGKSNYGTKKIQNPNVLIELGYAISQLGWNRTLILFNKNFGGFEDLPFDIEKRSCLDFNIIKSDDKNGIGQLRTELIGRIKSIILNNPERPQNRIEPLDRERANDLKQLKALLQTLNIQALDTFFRIGHNQISFKVANGIKQMKLLTSSKSFYLNDKRLKKLVSDFEKTWADIFKYILKYYQQGAEAYANALPNKGRPASITKMIMVDIKTVEKSFNSLLKYLRSNYPEIEI